MFRQARLGENICKLPDNGLESRIYKRTLRTQLRQTTQLKKKKKVKDLNKYFTKEDTWVAK